MDTKEKVKKGRAIVLQAIVDVYLEKNGKAPAKELFKDFYTDEYGKLNMAQYQMLHFYLIDEFRAIGLNLSEEIKKHGEEETPGKLSEFEAKELMRRVDDMMLIFVTLQKRKAELYTKA